MNRCKRLSQSSKSTSQYHQNSCQVTREQEQDSTLDIFIEVSTVFNCLDNRCKVIVCQNHCRSIFRNFRSGNAHRYADICLFQCWGIVYAIPCHGNHTISSLPSPYNPDFVFWSNTGINRLILDKVHQLFICIGIQCRTLYGFGFLLQNADFLCNCRSSYNMVTCNHHWLNACCLAGCNCLC